MSTRAKIAEYTRPRSSRPAFGTLKGDSAKSGVFANDLYAPKPKFLGIQKAFDDMSNKGFTKESKSDFRKAVEKEGYKPSRELIRVVEQPSVKFNEVVKELANPKPDSHLNWKAPILGLHHPRYKRSPHQNPDHYFTKFAKNSASQPKLQTPHPEPTPSERTKTEPAPVPSISASKEPSELGSQIKSSRKSSGGVSKLWTNF